MDHNDERQTVDAMSLIPGAIAKIALTRYLTVIYANDMFYEITGMTRESLEIQNNEILNLVSKQNQSSIIMQIYDRKSMPVSEATFELSLNSKNLTQWLNITIKKSEDLYLEQYPIYYCSFHDITKLKEKISGLSTQLIKVQRLFDNVVSGIGKIVLDDNFTLIYGNDSFFSLLGYTRRDYSNLINNSTLESVYPQDVLKFRNFLLDNFRNKNRTFTFEIRLLKLDGNFIWVKIDGSLSAESYNEYPVYYCIFTNIDQLKRTQLKLSANYEQLNIISSITNDIIFRYNAVRDRITFSDKFKEVFGHGPVFNKFTKILKYMQENNVISPSSYKDLISRMDAAKDKETIVIYQELQIRTISNDYVWFSIYGKNVFDDAGRHVSTIGKIVNIDKVHREKEMLTERALYDGLTMVYNRSAAEAFIKEVLTKLEQNTLYGMFIIDIDNFKQINDTFGHPCGDAVLKEISSILKHHMEGNEILGRLGGDEFVIFFYNITSKTEFIRRGNLLCEDLNNQLYMNNKIIPYSTSIGGVLCHYREENYKHLYRIADESLYLSKKSGKNSFHYHIPAEEL